LDEIEGARVEAGAASSVGVVESGVVEDVAAAAGASAADPVCSAAARDRARDSPEKSW
jgi:hypothetical protein